MIAVAFAVLGLGLAMGLAHGLERSRRKRYRETQRIIESEIVELIKTNSEN